MQRVVGVLVIPTYVMVHRIHLGHQFMRVWVDVAKAPGAYLFRPNHEMLTIGEAVGLIVALLTEKVVARGTVKTLFIQSFAPA